MQRRSTQLSNASSDDWENFKRVYGKRYESDEEEQTRYSIFHEERGNRDAAHGGQPESRAWRHQV